MVQVPTIPTRARQFESISKQVGGKVEGTKKVICSQMDLPYNFSSLIAALSKLLDFRGRLRPQMASNRKNKPTFIS